MRIHPVEIISRRETVTAVTRVSGPPLFKGMPASLWFECPAAYREFLSERADAAVASLLLAAMSYGQDIVVEGPLSTRLYRGLYDLQEVAVRMYPDRMKRIAIHAEQLDSTSPPLTPHAVAGAFSGGVDSFYTLWSHLPRNDPDPAAQLTHGLFVRGFDIADAKNYERCRALYQKVFERQGLTLLTPHTNSRGWYAELDWSWMYIAPLAGMALALGSLLRRFYVPTGSTTDCAAPWGEFAQLNRLFSTETLEIIDDAPTTRKPTKIFALAHWDETYDHLRVCYRKIDGLVNCCRCAKCINTMAALELTGQLSRYKTFPLPLTRRKIRLLRVPHHAPFLYEWMLTQARECGRKDMALDYSVAFALSRVRWRLHTLRKVLQRD